MVPRERLAAFDIETPLDQVLTIVTHSPFSRWPVYRGSLDEVVGMLHTKDLVGEYVHGLRRGSLLPIWSIVPPPACRSYIELPPARS